VYSGRISGWRSNGFAGPAGVVAGCLALALLPSSAGAHPPPGFGGPDAQTGAATAVATGSATLNGVVDPNGFETWYAFRYGTDRLDHRTDFAPAGKGHDPVAVSANIAGLSPGTTYHVRLIAFTRFGFGFAAGDDVPFTTATAATAPPAGPVAPPPPTQSSAGSSTVAPPVLGKSVNVDVRTGTVKVKVPGAAGYVNVNDLASLPVGSILDTRDGSITLRSALPDGKTQAGIFHGGLFEVRQASGGLTELVLRGALTGCPKASTARAAATSKKKKKKRKPPRRLWGKDSNGSFRTRGGNSVATVRGTQWFVEDRCDGTLTRVSAGSVRVFDKARHRTVIVHAGHSYLAPATR
jgi:hypothetical protein